MTSTEFLRNSKEFLKHPCEFPRFFGIHKIGLEFQRMTMNHLGSCRPPEPPSSCRAIPSHPASDGLLLTNRMLNWQSGSKLKLQKTNVSSASPAKEQSGMSALQWECSNVKAGEVCAHPQRFGEAFGKKWGDERFSRTQPVKHIATSALNVIAVHQKLHGASGTMAPQWAQTVRCATRQGFIRHKLFAWGN